MYKHSYNVKNGTANNNSYMAPMLLITGPPGTSKILIIRPFTDLADLMELKTPLRTAFMGIDAINIDGYTMNSFLDMPIEMKKVTGTF